MREPEVESLERKIDTRREHAIGNIFGFEHRVQRRECDGGAACVADFADEFDQGLVATECMRAQDGSACFLGLIEPGCGQRDRGRSARVFGLELLPAARGPCRGGYLLAVGGDLVGALGYLRVGGCERGLDVAVGTTATVAARQRHVGEDQRSVVGIGSGQSARARRYQRRQAQGKYRQKYVSLHGGHYNWTLAPYNGSRERHHSIAARKNGRPL